MEYKDIEKSIELSLIGRSDEEIDKLKKELPSLLSYVDKVKKIANKDNINSRSINTMREDVVTEEDGKYTKKMLDASHSTSGKYIKVKKVL